MDHQQWQAYAEPAGGSRRPNGNGSQLPPPQSRDPYGGGAQLAQHHQQQSQQQHYMSSAATSSYAPVNHHHQQHHHHHHHLGSPPSLIPGQTQQLRDGNGDVAMHDIAQAQAAQQQHHMDPYGSTASGPQNNGSLKYAMRPHHAAHLSGGAAVGGAGSGAGSLQSRYSPMETLSPTSPYAPKQQQQTAAAQGQYYVTTPSQNRQQSPTRMEYTPGSPYNANSAAAARQLPPLTPYHAAQGGGDGAGYGSPPSGLEPPPGYPGSSVGGNSAGGDPKSPVRRPVVTAQTLATNHYGNSGSGSHPGVLGVGPPGGVMGGQQHQQQQNHPPGKGPVPEFKKLRALSDLKPKVNAQPMFRRANPEGGFISVSLFLTTGIPFEPTMETRLQRSKRCKRC